MAGTLRERRKQLLREEILEAAGALMAEKGYASMSMDELAAQVGISKPTLYTYFATKDELVVEAITRDMRRMAALFAEQPDTRTPLERLAFILRELLERQVRAHSLGLGPWPELFRLLCDNDEALAALQQLDRYVVAQVQAGIAAGEIDAALDPAAVVRAFYGMVGAIPKGRLSSVLLLDPPQSVDGLVEIFVRGVRAVA
jgi:AcrR family transcriptional regulator